MRVRHNNRVIRSVTRTAFNNNITHTKCNGVVESSSSTVGALSGIVAAARHERMTDSLGRNKSNKVIHRKHEYDITSDQSLVVYASHASDGNNSVYRSSWPHAWFDSQNKGMYDSSFAWNVDNDVTVPPYWTIDSSALDEDKLKEDVLEKARQLKADHLLNIIQANQMWPSIMSLAKCIPEMGRNWTRLRNSIKTASGAFLAWKFGVSPVLQDTMATLRYLPKLTSDLRRRANGDSSRFGIVAQLPMSFDSSPLYTGTQNGYTVFQTTKQGRIKSPPNVRYVLVVKPTVKYTQDIFKMADLCMARFATSPAQLAWELVPFSFVLDWFVDLRGLCRAVDKCVGSSPYEIVSFTRSYSYSMGIDSFVTTSSPCDGTTLDTWRACSAEYAHYERIPVDSPGIMPKWIPQAGKNHAAIAAALIGQMLVKHSNWSRLERGAESVVGKSAIRGLPNLDLYWNGQGNTWF